MIAGVWACEPTGREYPTIPRPHFYERRPPVFPILLGLSLFAISMFVVMRLDIVQPNFRTFGMPWLMKGANMDNSKPLIFGGVIVERGAGPVLACYAVLLDANGHEASRREPCALDLTSMSMSAVSLRPYGPGRISAEIRDASNDRPIVIYGAGNILAAGDTWTIGGFQWDHQETI